MRYAYDRCGMHMTNVWMGALMAVRLVASDMDGTFLDAESKVPEGSYDLVRRLDASGMRFVASSGRRLDTLRTFFGPVADHMDFVAASGAEVMVAGELVDREVFSRVALRRLVRVVDRFECLSLALFDGRSSYLFDDAGRFSPELDKDLPNPVRARELPGVDAGIVKASICCDGDVMDMAYVLTRELSGDFVFAPSGECWIDVMQRGVSKATGLEQVMEAYGVDASEVMAFGDSMNDLEMLRLAGHPIAMANARDAVKELAARTIGSNAEHAVQRELESLLAE